MPIKSSLDLYLLPGPIIVDSFLLKAIQFYDVSTASGGCYLFGHKLTKRSGSFIIHVNQSTLSLHKSSSGPQLDHYDLEQKFYKKTGRRLQFDAKEPVGFDKTKVECFNCHNTGHYARECRSKGYQESRRRDAGNTGYKAKDKWEESGKTEELMPGYSLMEKVLMDLDSCRRLRRALCFDGLQQFRLRHLVPPPMTGLYMPPKSDFGIDKSNFTYGPKYSKTSESGAKTCNFDSCETNSSVETVDL
ncbi:ribonuclease H-like domain-containing protein [Tanacetum coccineum]